MQLKYRLTRKVRYFEVLFIFFGKIFSDKADNRIIVPNKQEKQILFCNSFDSRSSSFNVYIIFIRPVIINWEGICSLSPGTV